MKRTTDISLAAGHLKSGGLVAFATETVYGLGADASNDTAVAAIYQAKGRPQFNPLIVHVATFEAAQKLGIFNQVAQKLAQAFWPGPLTLVVPRMPDCPVSLLATAGLDSLAIRVPAHKQAHALLEQFDGPVVAPSANPSGTVSPTSIEHVITGLEGKIDMVLDGGDCAVGVESTIVSSLDETATILRHGGLARANIEATLGVTVADGQIDSNNPTAPGQLKSHYAPRAKLRLNVVRPEKHEAFLEFGPCDTDPDLNLSPKGDLIEAAANLFRMLHKLDAQGVEQIAVAPIPNYGLGEAINDRLRRAATSRETG